VAAAWRRLLTLNCLEQERRPRARHEGGYKLYYRLAAGLYPQADEAYAMVPGSLFYGGTWALLPSPAYRHLYVVVACLDPIGDEGAYLARIAEDLQGDWDRCADAQDRAVPDPAARARAIQAKILAAQRGHHPLSIRDLVRYSGLQRSTAVEALRGLLVPMFGNAVDARTKRPSPHIALLKRGAVQPRRPTWYAPDRQAWDWGWISEVMNSPERVRKARDRLWPHLLDRWTWIPQRPPPGAPRRPRQAR
jgi:hypothetical protein